MKKSNTYFTDEYTNPPQPWSTGFDLDEYMDAPAKEDEVMDATVTVYDVDRCVVRATCGGTEKEGYFTSSEVVGALIAEKLIPVSAHARIRYKVGGTRHITLMTTTGLWDCPVDYAAEEFGDEYAEQVAARLHRDYPGSWCWEPKF